NEIAYYVMGSLGGRRPFRNRPGWWSDEAHTGLLAMVDEMVALGSEPVPTAAETTPAQPLSDALVVDDSLRGELVEQLAWPAEHAGGDQQVPLAHTLHRGEPTRLKPRAALLHELAPALGQRRQHDPAILV